MKSQSTSSATLKFSSPEINASSSSPKAKMPAGGKTPQMPKNKKMITPAPAKKRMPKRSKM